MQWIYKAIVNLLVLSLFCQNAAWADARYHTIAGTTALHSQQFIKASQALACIAALIEKIGTQEMSLSCLRQLGNKPAQKQTEALPDFARHNQVLIPASTEPVLEGTFLSLAGSSVWIHGSGWHVRIFESDQTEDPIAGLSLVPAGSVQRINEHCAFQVYIETGTLVAPEDTSDPERGGAVGKWQAEKDLKVRDGWLVGALNGIAQNKGQQVQLMVPGTPVRKEHSGNVIHLRAEPLLKQYPELQDRLRAEVTSWQQISDGLPEQFSQEKKDIRAILETIEEMLPQVYLIEDNLYINGYGSADCICVNRNLMLALLDQDISGFIELFHEVGHAMGYSHTYLRGIGKKARVKDRPLNRAERGLPHEKGLQDILFKEKNQTLSSHIQAILGQLRADAGQYDELLFAVIKGIVSRSKGNEFYTENIVTTACTGAKILFDLGLITPDNAPEAADLVIAIADCSGDYAFAAFAELALLLQAAGEMPAEQRECIADLSFLREVVELTQDHTGPAFDVLTVFGNKGIIVSDNQRELGNLLGIVHRANAAGFGLIKTMALVGYGKRYNQDKLWELLWKVLRLEMANDASISNELIELVSAVPEMDDTGAQLVRDIDFLTAILEKLKQHSGAAYLGLKELLCAGEDMDDYCRTQIINEPFLRKLTSTYHYRGGEVYRGIKELACMLKGLDQNIQEKALNYELLFSIARNPAKNEFNNFIALGSCVAWIATFDQGIQDFLLDLELLKLIARCAQIHCGESYKRLCELAAAAKEFSKETRTQALKTSFLRQVVRKSTTGTAGAFVIIRILAESGGLAQESMSTIRDLLWNVIPEKISSSKLQAYNIITLFCDAGMVTPQTFKQLIALFMAVSRYVPHNANTVFTSLYLSLRQMSSKSDSVRTVLMDPELLRSIVLFARGNSDQVFSILARLSREDILTEETTKDSIDLFKQIAEAMGAEPGKGYAVLLECAQRGLITGENFPRFCAFIIDTAKEIRKKAHSSEAVAFDALLGLIRVQAVQADNLDDVKKLLVEISKSHHWGKDYGALKDLTDGASLMDESVRSCVFDCTMLSQVIEGAKNCAEESFQALSVLGEYGVISKDTQEEIVQLLIAIDKALVDKSWEIGNAAGAYKVLEYLAKAGRVSVSTIDQVRMLVTNKGVAYEEFGQYLKTVQKVPTALQKLLYSFPFLASLAKSNAYGALDTLIHTAVTRGKHKLIHPNLIKKTSELRGENAADGYKAFTALAEVERDQQEIMLSPGFIVRLVETRADSMEDIVQSMNTVFSMLKSFPLPIQSAVFNKDVIFAVMDYAETEQAKIFNELYSFLSKIRSNDVPHQDVFLNTQFLVNLIRGGGTRAHVRLRAAAEFAVDLKSARKDIVGIFLDADFIQQCFEQAGGLLPAVLKSIKGIIETCSEKDIIIQPSVILYGMRYLDLKGKAVAGYFRMIRSVLRRKIVAKDNGVYYVKQAIYRQALKNHGIKKVPAKLVFNPWVVEQIIAGNFRIRQYNREVETLDFMEINPDALDSLSPKEKALVYTRLCMEFPSIMERVDYDRFEQDPTVSYILWFLRKETERFYLTEADRDDLIALSLLIDKQIHEYIQTQHEDDPLWISGFRQLMQLHGDFVQLYLSSLAMDEGEMGVENVLPYFLMCSHSVWGTLFGDEYPEFKGIMCKAIDEYRMLFLKLTLGDPSIWGLSIEKMVDRYCTRSITTVQDPVPDGLLYGIGSAQRLYYSLRTSAELSHPSLCILSAHSMNIFDDVIRQLAEDTAGLLYRIPLSYYTDRSVLFSSPVPVSNDSEDTGETDASPGTGIKQLPGVITRLIQEAQKDSQRPVYLVLDNVEAVDSSLRVEFNPVLWEKKILVPELGKEGEFVLPANLHIIFTMDDTSTLNDEAFCNRLARIRVGELQKTEYKNLLQEKYHVPAAEALRISSFYAKLAKVAWEDERIQFYPQEFVAPITFAERRGSIRDYCEEEIFRYCLLKFRSHKDQKTFIDMFADVFSPADKSWYSSALAVEDNMIVADGVSIPLAREAAEYIEEHPGAGFFEIVLKLYGYALRRQDMRIISQFIRQREFAGSGDAQPFTVLEGISGEGKTQLAFVMAQLFGMKNLCYTLHRRSDLDELRGGIFPDGNGGLRVVNETEFTRALEQGGYIINFSELNTVYKQALVYWLFPEFSGQRVHTLPEIPCDQKDPFYHKEINRDNLFIADINPLDYAAREPLPEQIRSCSALFWVGYDYTNKDEEYVEKITEELVELVNNLFIVYCSAEGDHAAYARKLARLYLRIQQELYTSVKSNYQVLTIRDLIRAVRLFDHYGADQQAFDRSVSDVLWGMWIEDDVRDRVEGVMSSVGVNFDAQEYDAQEVLATVLDSDLGHVLIHSDNTRDGLAVLNDTAGKGYRTHYMCVNDFCEFDMFVGGGGIDLEGNLGVFAGSLLKVIEQTLCDPDQIHLLVLDNFHLLNTDTAVGFNRMLQDGIIDIPEQLLSVLAERLRTNEELLAAAQGRYGELTIPELVQCLYTNIPESLRIVGICYAPSDPTSDDSLPMSGAELSRFVSIRAGTGMNEQWIQRYIKRNLQGLKPELLKAIISDIIAVYNYYDAYVAEGYYVRSPLSRTDIDECINEIKNYKGDITRELLKEVIYYTIGVGLREPFAYSPILTEIEKEDGIYLKVGAVEYKTKHTSLEQAQSSGTLVPIHELRQVYEGILSAFRKNRRVVLLEGHPGVGKTAAAEDLSARLGYGPRFKKVSMYKDIDLWEFLGKIEQTGDNAFRLTCAEEDGTFLSDFLDYVENGGIFCFDEGNISNASIQIISFLVQIMRDEDIVLGLYHNGVELERKISIHPDFRMFVTFNPAGMTQGRNEFSPEIMYLSKKIWMTDMWKRSSYLDLIDAYDAEDSLFLDDRTKLIQLHIYMKYIMDENFRRLYRGKLPKLVKEFRFNEFQDVYTYQYNVSPRELIRIVRTLSLPEGLSDKNDTDMIKDKLYIGILVNYVYQFSNLQDFNRAVAVVDGVFPGFKEFVHVWQNCTDIGIDEDTVTIGGFTMPRYAETENVPESDEMFFRNVKTQVGALKALAISLAAGENAMLISEQGSMPMELVKQYSYLTGTPLYVFDGSPYSSSIELLGGEMISFDSFDKTGNARGEALETILGFIGSHLVKQGDHYTGPRKILYLSGLSVLADEELEILNDFLNTRTVTIGSDTYELPHDIGLVVESPVVREKLFSSPFFNRFQKIGLPGLKAHEVYDYMDAYYKGLTDKEKRLIYRGAVLAWYQDSKLHSKTLNVNKEGFSHAYGFSLQDIWQVCELVMLEKARAGKKINSVRVVFSALCQYYGNALDDINNDRALYFQTLFEEVMPFTDITMDLLKAQSEKARKLTRKWSTVKVAPGKTLPNGVSLNESDHSYKVVTPGNTYIVTKKEIQKGEVRLSEGLIMRKKDDSIMLSFGLIARIGAVDTGITRKAMRYALPPEEVSQGSFIEYHGVINEIASQLLWSTRRVKDSSGRTRTPLVNFLMGPTGGAKSTLVRSLGAVLGIPVHTLTCFKGMESDSIIAGMEIDHDGKVHLQLKEFFSHFGRINGEYYHPQGKKVHSARKILFLDEANVNPEILYLLRPLFRGERTFDVFYLGQVFHVELDPEVMVMLAGNPEDSFDGRKTYPRELIERGVKLWVPALHQYLTSERISKADLEKVLRALHGRRMQEARGVEAHEVTDETRVIDAPADPLKLVVPRDVVYIESEGRESQEIEAFELEAEQTVMPLIKNETFTYSVDAVRQRLTELKDYEGNEKLSYFVDAILPEYILALTDGAAQHHNWYDRSLSVTFQVLNELKAIDEQMYLCLKTLVGLYLEEKIRRREVRGIMLEMRKLVLNKVDRFLFSFELNLGKRLGLYVKPEPIIQTTILTGLRTTLGVADSVEEYCPLRSYAVKSHPFGEEKIARGVYKGLSEQEGYYALVYAGEAAPTSAQRSELLDWSGFHELGHVVTELRIRYEQLKHPNIELFSMLFPVIFGVNRKQYYEAELLTLLQAEPDKKCAYCQAAKGITNGFVRVLKGKFPGKEDIQDLREITDVFEKDRIVDIWEEIGKLSDDAIRRIAVKLYKNAYKKRFEGSYYLDTTGKGEYTQQAGKGSSMIAEFSEGQILHPPDVSTDSYDDTQVPVDEQVSIQGEGSEEKEDVPEIEPEYGQDEYSRETGQGEDQDSSADREGEAGEEEDEADEPGQSDRQEEREGASPEEGPSGRGKTDGSGEVIEYDTEIPEVVSGSWVEECSAKAGGAARRFIDIFMRDYTREDVYKTSGRRLDIKRWVTRQAKPFRKTIYEESRPQLAMDITVDVSGSVTSDSSLVSAFTQMSKFFLSLLFRSSTLYREGVHYGFGAIGSNFHNRLPLHNRYTREELQSVISSDDSAWMRSFNDGSGIDTEVLVRGLKKKWKAAKQVAQENRLEIVFTDGAETGRHSSGQLNEMVLELEQECNVNVVFVGIGAPEVKQYHRYIALSSEPEAKELINIITRLGIMLMASGKLPAGDLAEIMGLQNRMGETSSALTMLRQSFGGQHAILYSPLRRYTGPAPLTVTEPQDPEIGQSL